MSLSIAVIGAGYWGPNLVRNFRSSADWDLVAVCDLDAARARKVIGTRSTVEVETSLERLLARDDIDAVAIATPARTHSADRAGGPRGRQARAGREAAGRQPGRRGPMVDEAEARGLRADDRPHLLLHAGGQPDRAS